MYEEAYLMQNMTEQQKMMFMNQMAAERKDGAVGVLLAFFLGCFGAHRFYLHENGLGILYACFFWTGVTAVIAFVECFFMPGRVRRYNAELANRVAYEIQTMFPATA